MKRAIDDEHERHQEQQREPDYADGFKVNWDAIEQTQSNSKQRRIERAQKTNKLIKVFGRDRREPENERERTRSNHIKIGKRRLKFRDNSIKTHNDFVRLLQDNFKKSIQKRFKQNYDKRFVKFKMKTKKCYVK